MVKISRSIIWVKAAREAFEEFPKGPQIELARRLTIGVRGGGIPQIATALLKGLGVGVIDLPPRHRGDAFRGVYASQIGSEVWVVHAFQKQAKDIKTLQKETDLVKERLKAAQGTVSEKIEWVQGSGNIFRDFHLPNPDIEQFRSILAARILLVLKETGVTEQKAQQLTGIAAADFSRMRRGRVGRFTIDRMLAILDCLGQEVEISITVHPRMTPTAAASLRPVDSVQLVESPKGPDHR